MTAYESITLVLGALGAVSTPWLLAEHFLARRRISWQRLQRGVNWFVSELSSDNYSPDLIVGVGRSGALLAALLSVSLGNRPFSVIDVEFTWEKNRRRPRIRTHAVIDVTRKRVLVVDGELHTGETLRLVLDSLEAEKPEELRSAVLVCEDGAPIGPEYVYLRTNRKRLKLPWMFPQGFRMDYVDKPLPTTVGNKCSV